MKKMLTALALAAMASSANAGYFAERSLIQLAKQPGDTELQAKIQTQMSQSPDAALKWFKTWASYENQPVISAAWSEVGLNLLRWSQPGKSYEWRSAVRVDNLSVPVYQQDSLIDLERTHAYHLSYPMTTGTVHNYQIADTSNPAFQTIATSERRLTMGLPPVGPDNALVKVCKMGRSSAAPFIEMSETQRLAFAQSSGLDFNLCLSGKQASAYWQARYDDFVDRFYDRTENHKPGASW